MAKGKYRNYTTNFLDEIVKDFKAICQNDNMSLQAAHDMAWLVSWELTEWCGADIGCQHWTKNAFDLLRLDEIIFQNGNTIKYKRPTNKVLKERFKGKIIHEHVIPRNLFTDYIMYCKENKKEPQKENFEKIILCIVTKDEDDILSKNFKSYMPEQITLEKIKNPWQRYKDSNITKILKVKWEKEFIEVEPLII